MLWTNQTQSTRSFLFAVALIGLTAVGLWLGAKNNPIEANTTILSKNTAPAATFTANAGTLGAIPDHVGTCQTAPFNAGRNVTFTASGLTGAVTNVELSTTFGGPNHSWVGDITAILIAPNGASHTVFGRTLATTATSSGDSTDLAGPYIFKDSATSPPSGGWWQAANILGAAVPMTSGDYRTTNAGGAGAPNPQPPTSMNPSFAGVADGNGTWTLRLTDGCAQDTGAISAAVLTVETGIIEPNDANVDMNGDGKTDFVVVRGTSNPLTEATGPGELSPNKGAKTVRERQLLDRTGDQTKSALAPPIYWYTSINGSGATGVGQLGDAETDFLVPQDFDGDGKDDLAVWTLGNPLEANFKIFQSTTNTVRVELFGQTGDDPTVVGDYDGDGKADPAVFRCPPFGGSPGQCYYYYRGSLNNPSGNITFVPWGFGVEGDFFPNVGDFDGDEKLDFCLQRTNPAAPSQGQFVLLKSSNFGVEYINWGLNNDFIIPGDYDGDGQSDFCVRRTVGGNHQYWILTRTGAQSFVVWGITDDVSAPGDYDGDGRTDLATWRGSADPNSNYFWILNSGNGSVSQFEWGQCPTPQTCDFPVAGYAVH